MSFLQISRNLSTTTCLMLRRLAKRSNPGVDHQIAAIEDAVEVMQSDPEGFEGLEGDLMNAHKSHKQLELELRQQKARVRQYLVRKKYFHKSPLPNFLTYAEKEQIKYLHSSDKEEWTVEKLAESFPANSVIIQKVLKTYWSPMSTKKIHSHDKSVLKNWERFRKGEFAEIIDTEFCEHLQKFVDRRNTDLKESKNFNNLLKKQWQRPESVEFSSILSLNTAYDKIKCIPKTPHFESKQNNTSLPLGEIVEVRNDDTFLLGRIRNTQPIRVKELKSIKPVHDNSNLLNTDYNSTLSQGTALRLKDISETGIAQEKLTFDYTEKFTSNEVVINEEDRKRYGMSRAKECIHIPRKVWRKGAIYRVEDCYYDDDGEFLYRVPGMNCN